MINRLYPALLLIVSVLALGSCVKDDHDPVPEPSRVLLVYVGTDNNLSGYEQAKIQGLRDGWSGRKSDHIIVYRDTRGAGARLIEISGLATGEAPRELAVYGTENSASAATLSRVIHDVRTLYPAESYGLLIFSHASGWLPQGIYNQFSSGNIPGAGGYGHADIQMQGDGATSRSVVMDGSDEMELTDLAAAIPDGVFDYIAFEACFMAGIEVAYELRYKTPLILASSAEIVDPGFAPVYAASTAKLMAGNLTGFGQDAYGHTLTYAENSVQRSATLTVIRTAGLDALASFVRANCDFTKVVDVAEVQHFDRMGTYRLFFDFEDTYGRLLETDAGRAELSRLVAGCVGWKAATPGFMNQTGGYNGFSINRHSGMTTYIPQGAFPGLNTAYGRMTWTHAITGGVGVIPWDAPTV